MNAPLHARPRATLGPGATRPTLRQALVVPVLVLLASCALVVVTKRSGWLSVGGAVISGLGARLWANRLFRVGALRSDEELPPPFFPAQPGAPGVQFNPGHANALGQQAMDNYLSAVGVWISIVGGMLGSAGPFLLGLAWPSLIQ
jgi:hypothetical protein